LSQVHWTISALADLREIRRYIEEFNPSAAREVAQRLLDAGNSLVTLPHRGRPATDNVRELTTVSPYVIRYEIRDDEVHILRVRHGMRRQ